MLKPNQKKNIAEEVSLAEHVLEPLPIAEKESQPPATPTKVDAGSSLASKTATSEAELLDPRILEAGKRFVELLRERLLDQSYPSAGSDSSNAAAKETTRRVSSKTKIASVQREQVSAVRRITEMADKFMRIVEEHCGKMPLSLPPESLVFSDRRIVGMLNSQEFISDASLSYKERTEVIQKNLPELYDIFRKRFLSDFLGKPINLDTPNKARTNAEAPAQSAPAAEVADEAQSPLTEVDGPSIGQTLRESTSASAQSQGADELSEMGEDEDVSAGRDLNNYIPPVSAQPTADSAKGELLQASKLAIEELKVERKKAERNTGVAMKPFSSQLLATKLIAVSFPTIFESFLDTRPDLVTILDLLNVPRRDLLSIANFGEKRLKEVEHSLAHFHPGTGLLFASVREFPLPVEIVEQLGKRFVQPSIFINGTLSSDPKSFGLPIDNGLRLLQMTSEIIKFAGVTPQMHAAIAERFYEVGFPRPRPTS